MGKDAHVSVTIGVTLGNMGDMIPICAEWDQESDEVYISLLGITSQAMPWDEFMQRIATVVEWRAKHLTRDRSSNVP